MSRQAQVIFRGRVQGVWFRAFTSEAAEAAELTGWVRNRPDGSVEALFEGEQDTIKSVIEKCRQGPPSARVDHIDVSWADASNDFEKFTVRY